MNKLHVIPGFIDHDWTNATPTSCLERGKYMRDMLAREEKLPFLATFTISGDMMVLKLVDNEGNVELFELNMVAHYWQSKLPEGVK